jgi:aspartyl-tRNA(Asn)/glutamyl-tRNA(Gln) amidotransferase subunit C
MAISTEMDEKLTRRLATLARLELTDEEVRTFTAQLGGIVGFFDQLGQADVSGVESLELMVHPIELPTALREDVVVPSPVDSEGRPRVLESAPDVLHDGFKVPPVL